LKEKFASAIWKSYEESTKVHAHDENNEASIGDMVTVKECRPIL
jgi:small subunit ribosomal protein S17